MAVNNPNYLDFPAPCIRTVDVLESVAAQAKIFFNDQFVTHRSWEPNLMSDVNEMYNEAEKLKDDGKLDDSITKLNEILSVSSEHVLSHLALAVVYGRVGKHDDAVKHAQRACEIDPNDPFNFTAASVTLQRAWQGTQRPEFIQLAEDAMAKAHALQGPM